MSETPEHQNTSQTEVPGEQSAPQGTHDQPLEGEVTEQAGTEAASPVEGDQPAGEADGLDPRDAKILELQALADERTSDLQRLQAEYVNYKKRVDRDRALSKQLGAEMVVQDLLPVLDSIELARQHGDVNEGFQMVADALAKLAEKHGLVAFGVVGEAFDPTLHEALMQAPMPDGTEITETTISQVMQTGYKLGERVLRPARVGVANPA